MQRAVAPMTQEEHLLLNELISGEFGICFPEHRRDMLEARLRPRVQALRLGRFLDYYLQLRCDGDGERARLAELVTNNETYFFREAHQFAALFEEALPELRERAARPGTLRLLSAGCSSGEEPYTLAILARQHGVRLAGVEVTIDAFDLDPRRVELAHGAEYGRGSLRSLDPEQVRRWFSPLAGERFALQPLFRLGVRFARANLLHYPSFAPPLPYDAVFCRNVLIYFSEPALHRALDHFARLLRPGGLLFLGHAESIIGLSDQFATVRLGPTTIAYRRA
ncbi:MAG TPA: protein-glutamate O-methyltransferase CheR [Thermoanaerobaculia bacterium]|nr:protein-glutamate O-methyltransferase CheR [Thermoanaerobaculia bacterium]